MIVAFANTHQADTSAPTDAENAATDTETNTDSHHDNHHKQCVATKYCRSPGVSLAIAGH